MRLSFDSIEEVQAFVKQIKGTRSKKDEADEAAGNAPAPLMPNPGQAGGAVAGFPGAGGFTPQTATGAFPSGPSPEVGALVNRITTRMDSAIQSGATKADDMLAWFRGQCAGVDPSAANATLDQIKQIFLPRLGVAALENIAKLMSA